MIGAILSSPCYADMANEAAKRFTQHTGLDVIILHTNNELNYERKLDLVNFAHNQTIVMFDADLWFIRDTDLSELDNLETIAGVVDPGRFDKSHFPIHDSKLLGMKNNVYINTGLVIFNERHIRAFYIAVEIMQQYRYRLKDFGEQSALNYGFQNTSGVTLINPSYNYMPFAENEIEGYPKLTKPATIHAAGYAPDKKIEALNYLSKKYLYD
jgi:hypothetical protein